MLDDDTTTTSQDATTDTPAEPAAPAPDTPSGETGSETREEPGETAAETAPPAKKAAARKTAKKAPAKKTAARKTAARKSAETQSAETRPADTRSADTQSADTQSADTRSADTRSADEPGAEPPAEAPAESAPESSTEAPADQPAPKKKATKKAAAKKTTAKKKAPKADTPEAVEDPADAPAVETAPEAPVAAEEAAPATSAMLLFQAPDVSAAPARRTRKAAAPAEEKAADAKADLGADDTSGDEADTAGENRRSGQGKGQRSGQGKGQGKGKEQGKGPGGKGQGKDQDTDRETEADEEPTPGADEDREGEGDTDAEGGGARRRRRRGGRRRRKSGDGDNGDNGADASEGDDEAEAADEADSDQGEDQTSEGGTSRRRRRRRRAGEEGGDAADDPANTVTRVRKVRSAEDEITAVSGSTRLEAKKQRRREGREAGRRRAPIVSEAEFLARRESVDRVMVIRQREDLTQIGVLEDKVLVEHYVSRESQTSLIGNVYVGRVQNVLPSMEAAFIDIGKGRNAVLYAGEVNWSALGHKEGTPRKIESVLSSGQSVLVQVTKDPVGHKGARLTSQISLAGRFLVYVPDGTTSGISRKLPDTERTRLKTLLKEIVPDTAGVIVRTAAEGASEDELTRDVERLKARWEDIESKAKSGSAPKLLYGEPDLTLKVVRDLFTEDFSKLVIEGDDAWDTVQGYVSHVAPDLEARLERFERTDDGGDVFATYRIDEQIAKGLDRKVWLPSGGSLIIDRTEAMTVVDVNTGKFTGSGGNLEETVTKNNLEAAEEIVRQLRLRDIGGIIVVDFIDMVLESNRDLVLRRLVECLGRDRTRHQVAEVTSLGLVQMTRKRIGTGLLEAFSENCEHCQGRGLIVHDMPVEPKKSDDEGRRGGGRRSRGGRGRGGDGDNGSGGSSNGNGAKSPSPRDVAAVAKAENADKQAADGEAPTEEAAQAVTEKVSETAAEANTEAPEAAASADSGETTMEGGERRSSRSRSRRSASRRGGAARPADAAAETAAETVASTSAEPAVESPAAEVAAEPTAVEPAASASTEAPNAEESPAAEAETVETPAEPVAPPAPPEPPKVVTRTRRRSASRPAGPPTSTSTDGAGDGGDIPIPSLGEAVPPAGSGEPPVDGLVEPGTVDVEPAPTPEPHHELHVPIKKKGSRKR